MNQMLETLRRILEGVGHRLQQQLTTHLPAVLAAAILIVTAFLIAILVRWVLSKIFDGSGIDKFLRHSGLSSILDPSGRLRATKLVSEAAFWCILAVGVLAALSVFGTTATTEIAQSLALLLPRLAAAGLILLGGAWLSRYIGRSMLLWAVNEGIAGPRRLAAGVRVIVMFVAVVVSADYLNFARNVFLAAFIILVGGAVITTSLAVGIGASGRVRRFFSRQRVRENAGESERSLWSHL
jgi:hypothetical protein